MERESQEEEAKVDLEEVKVAKGLRTCGNPFISLFPVQVCCQTINVIIFP